MGETMAAVIRMFLAWLVPQNIFAFNLAPMPDESEAGYHPTPFEWRVVAHQLAAALEEEIDHSYLGEAANSVKANLRALANYRRLRSRDGDR